jgi:hypothetical protein
MDDIARSLQDLHKVAAPPCRNCGALVKRVETSWEHTGGSEWVPRAFWLICDMECRVEVKPFDTEIPEGL